MRNSKIYARRKAETEKKLGMSISDEMFRDALHAGILKLARHVKRFGDENGERLKPYYLDDLIIEDMRDKTQMRRCCMNTRRIREEEERCTALNAGAALNTAKCAMSV